MVPGAWVMTTSGFYGRYVETDGDVIVLETSDGTETLWTSRAIVSVGNPPFAPDAVDTNTEDASADKADNDEEAKELQEDSPTEENPVDEEKDEAAPSDSDSNENI